METENPSIRPISELLGENFFVPRYQRGYRWGEQEITELLDDILQYYLLTADRENIVSKFYCLQPIVIKKKEWATIQNEESVIVDGWELIDGQQRLTTLYLILSYLQDIRKKITYKHLANNTEIYLIDFETRENCRAFFDDRKFATHIDKSNVDFYHISKGYGYIEKWFATNGYEIEVLNTILKTDYNVSIIWYEAKESDTSLNQEDDSIDLFTRLNDGKIPLTDAELIKALLLQGDRYPVNDEKYVKQRIFEIASEWDEIEATLQDEKMWLFLNDTNYLPASKIEFIFRLLAEKWNKGNGEKLIVYEAKEGKPKHFEYLVFDRYLSQKRNGFRENTNLNKDILDSVNEIWKEIKEMFSVFNEWYQDHILYHYIGYLLAADPTKKEKIIKELLSIKVSKTDFVTYLKKEVALALNFKKKKENSVEMKTLSDFSYGEDNNEIIKILLLFNIETLITFKKENARFPFHLYKKEKITSIEHIHPQNPDNVDTDEERSIIWMEGHKQTLELIKPSSEEQKLQIKNIISEIERLLRKYNKESFKAIYSPIIELYTQISEIKETEVHTLYNLALVDKDTNSALNNSFFNIKRDILKENKLTRYIPICTQRVFSKYYSQQPQEMIFWSNDDRKAYFNEIELMYTSFINLLNVADENE